MRRILFAVAVLAALLTTATPAEARHWHWGHHHHGWGHHHHGWGGYGGWGWGGYGGYCGYGWGGYGVSIAYRPFYNYGWNFGVPAYGYPSYINGGYYPGYNYRGYYPSVIGYGYLGNNTRAGTNVDNLVLSPRPAAGNTTPAQVLNLLRLDNGSVIANLRDELQLRGRGLPRIGPLQETTITGDTQLVSRPLVNTSNIAQRRKADQQIATGDMLFREQKFHAALQRYKDASRLAPDMAETYWRQGHALIATANFALAGGAFKRALALDSATSRDGFSLDQLYGPATIAKTSHVEDLAAWALDHANTSDAYFLMGVTLQYDGQADRAAKFFARAAEIAGPSGSHIAAFVPVPAVDAPDAAALVDNTVRPPRPLPPPADLRVPPLPPAAQPPFAADPPAPIAEVPVNAPAPPATKLVEI
jgi:tetratricopeptide (TPR) repeat protein